MSTTAMEHAIEICPNILSGGSEEPIAAIFAGRGITGQKADDFFRKLGKGDAAFEELRQSVAVSTANPSSGWGGQLAGSPEQRAKASADILRQFRHDCPWFAKHLSDAGLTFPS